MNTPKTKLLDEHENVIGPCQEMMLGLKRMNIMFGVFGTSLIFYFLIVCSLSIYICSLL